MATTAPLNLDNIQGDILSGLPKKTQKFIIFEIDNADRFKKHLAKLVPLLKSTSDILKDRKAIDDSKKYAREHGKQPELVKMVGVNISFSHEGLVKLGITDDIKDPSFTAGQKKQAQALGDDGSFAGPDGAFEPDWDPAFKRPERIHGVIIIAGDSHATVDNKTRDVKHIFGVGDLFPSIDIVTVLAGDTRPGKEDGHEHFGFMDGISNPAVKDVDKTLFPGQEAVRQGKMLLGREADSVTDRPAWATDGSFLVFRYLFQRVPEFDDFLHKNAISAPGLSQEDGAQLLGARLVGRWKSGAPIDITPLKDDPKLAKDPQRNNNFRFQGEATSAEKCPFAAHVRKTNPRADLEDHKPIGSITTEDRRIMRRGIQFGPEVTPSEKAAKKTQHGRGLLFACYQSNIANGFEFIQESWANNTGFPIDAPQNPPPGFDPIIGQTNNTNTIRTVAAADIDTTKPPLQLPADDFVVSRGGEYFFTPAIDALRTNFAATAAA